MKKLLFFAMLLSAVVACKSNSGKEAKAPSGEAGQEAEAFVFTPGDTVAYKSINIDYDKDLGKGYSVNVVFDVQYVDDDRLPAEARDSINAWIGDILFDADEESFLSMEALAERKAKAIEEAFSEEIFDGDDEDNEYFLDFGRAGNENTYGIFSPVVVNGFVNYFISGDDYHFGAAHGYHYVTPEVFSLTTGKRLTQEELFIEGFEAPLAELLEKCLFADENYEEDMLFEGIGPNDNFYFTTEGMTYVYNPYEIAAYCYGVIEVDIPSAELKGLLRPQFVDLWD